MKPRQNNRNQPKSVKRAPTRSETKPKPKPRRPRRDVQVANLSKLRTAAPLSIEGLPSVEPPPPPPVEKPFTLAEKVYIPLETGKATPAKEKRMLRQLGEIVNDEPTPAMIWAEYRAALKTFRVIEHIPAIMRNVKDDKVLDKALLTIDRLYPIAAAIVLHENGSMIDVEQGKADFSIKDLDLDVPDEVEVDESKYLPSYRISAVL